MNLALPQQCARIYQGKCTKIYKMLQKCLVYNSMPIGREDSRNYKELLKNGFVWNTFKCCKIFSADEAEKQFQHKQI